jgi:hypothetical protein
MYRAALRDVFDNIHCGICGLIIIRHRDYPGDIFTGLVSRSSLDSFAKSEVRSPAAPPKRNRPVNSTIIRNNLVARTPDPCSDPTVYIDTMRQVSY